MLFNRSISRTIEITGSPKADDAVLQDGMDIEAWMKRCSGFGSARFRAAHHNKVQTH